MDKGDLQPGLYLISTPIGNARDITLRAMDTLAGADVLAAEDTRTLRRLMEIHGIALNGRKIVAYHDHNAQSARPGLMKALAEGRSVAYASDAGTPLVADPGFGLVRSAREEGYSVTAVPGASAALAALTVAGLPTDRFLFQGFLPAKSGARRAVLTDLSAIHATLVIYESPHRIAATLDDAVTVLGPDRQAALCRELTKKFEETRLGSLADLARSVADDPPRGEIVLLIEPAPDTAPEPGDVDDDIRELLGSMTLKEAVARVAGMHGLKRRDVYQRALALRDDAE
ncbi:16S rRNA (cytidine(1402)-2'-O)-methyltransferase [Pseudaestuariivita atlantica]|uniref:Ribosomal RNA small subunit methyltransferase I n=1 Tax=Pseudaestuariivita atlantica TaxID=1317121 RepID=A0A0L1JTD8_9RHOB|nr:16S rRNA (cytidine(1402)-2'-O)-methyltransferase [Pseudaestuariivita atlantica]KNG94952.1 16S rRNA methyltransferase [Pseudaestuariivita atlantica]